MNISSTICSGRLSIYLKGELDHHAARDTIKAIVELLDEYMPKECILDLAGLSFMDSSGIAVMIRVSRRMQTTGGKAWIENPSKQAQRVIEASGIERLVPVALSK